MTLASAYSSGTSTRQCQTRSNSKLEQSVSATCPPQAPACIQYVWAPSWYIIDMYICKSVLPYNWYQYCTMMAPIHNLYTSCVQVWAPSWYMVLLQTGSCHGCVCAPSWYNIGMYQCCHGANCVGTTWHVPH